MPTILLKRSNTSGNDSYTGQLGEVTVDTELNQLRLHDGSTTGGHVFTNGQDLQDVVDQIDSLSINDIEGLETALQEINNDIESLESRTDSIESDFVNKDGSVAFTGDVDAGSNKIVNLSDPVTDSSAATKGYVDSEINALGAAFRYVGTVDGSGSTESNPVDLSNQSDTESGAYYRVESSGYFEFNSVIKFLNTKDGIIFNVDGGFDKVDNTNSEVQGTDDYIEVTGNTDTGFVVDVDQSLKGRIETLEGLDTGVSSVSGDSPIQVDSSDSANPVISIDNVTASTDGAMIASDKEKLDGIAEEATKNESDADLRDRSTHTGTQTLSTISDAGEAASRGVAGSGDDVMSVGFAGLGTSSQSSEPDGSDLNEYTTSGSYYFSQGSSPSNRPEVRPGQLVVHVASSNRITQEWQSYETFRVWRRTRNLDNNWISWREIYHTGNTGNVVTRDVTDYSTDTTSGRLLQVGDGGLLDTNNLPELDLEEETNGLGAGFYRLSDSEGAIVGGVGNNNNFALCVDRANSSSSPGKASLRWSWSSDWVGEVELMHSGNTGDVVTRDVGEESGNVMEVGAFGIGTTNSVIGDQVQRLDLPTLGEATAVLLGKWRDNSFRMHGTVYGGRSTGFNTGERYFRADISTAARSNGSQRNVTALSYQAGFGSDVRVSKVDYEGEEYLAIVSPESLQIFSTSFIFSGFITGEELIAVDPEDISNEVSVADETHGGPRWRFNNNDVYHEGNTGDVVTRDVGEESGNVMEVGAFGLGRTGYIAYPVSDLDGSENSDVPAGLYSFNTSYSNRPSGVTGTIIVSARGSSSRVNMLISSESTPRFLIRYIDGSSIGSWHEVYHSGNTGDAVTRDVTDSSTDTTSGRLLQVGSGGLLEVSGQDVHWGTPFFQRRIEAGERGGYILLCDLANGSHNICGTIHAKRSSSLNTGNHFLRMEIVSSSGDVPSRRGLSWSVAAHSSTSIPRVVELDWDDRSWLAIEAPEGARPFSTNSYFSGMATEHPDLFRRIDPEEPSNVIVAKNRGANDNLDPISMRMGYLDYYGGNVLSSVSVDDEGTPTGGIIERGSNDNGEYVKFADGKVIMTTQLAAGDVTANGDGTFSDPYRSDTVSWELPVSIARTEGVNLLGTARLSSIVNQGDRNALSFGGRKGLTTNSVDNLQVVRNSSDSTPDDTFLFLQLTAEWH